MKIEFLNLRIIAYLLDSIIVQFFCFFINNAFELNKNLGSFPFFGREFTISFSCYFIMLLVYLWLMDLFAKGITFGKKVFRIKTIGQNERQLSIPNSMLRSFLKTLSLCLLLPLVYLLVTGKTFHDWIVKSKTVRT